MQSYRHWRLEQDAEKILWLYFDKQNAAVNTIDVEVMTEFSSLLDWLQREHESKGVVILSAKKHGFIAGADISQFKKFHDAVEAVNLLKQGQQIFNKLEKLSMPSVALIDGFCLGGGLELALACRYRIVEEGAKTRLGLPEVKLGIYPGWGGSVRLPRLIGALSAFGLILSGRTVSGKAAVKLGIADVAVPKRQLLRAARAYILGRPRPHQASWWQQLTNKKLFRMLLGRVMRYQLQAKVNPLHYPAPYQVLSNWEKVGVRGDEAFLTEAKNCARLFVSDTSKNLVRVFFLQERLKGLAKDIQFTPQHIHVVGAGTMGGDIAAWCALQGLNVTLQDTEPKLIAAAIKRAYGLFKEKLKEPYLIQRAMDRLMPDVHGYGIRKADVIIEAIFEDLTVKQELFKLIEQQAKPHAILATNTSGIPLDEINKVLRSPERLVGIHFFNPVPRMLLVEVVKGNCTDDTIVDKALCFVRKIDRLPLAVKSKPGFLVNRILMPYMLEAMILMEEGVPAVFIDKAMIEFGMPMGPVTLADTVGLDVCLSVAKYFGKYLHTPIPEGLLQLVVQKKLGRKTGQGFYEYRNGKKVKPKMTTSPFTLQQVTDRLVLRLLDEAFACLREDVVADGDLLDAGMIFGTGFAPFRGGPMHYAKTEGIHKLYEQYVEQRKAIGKEVAATWEENVEVT